jgi:type IV pilus assembly protein PilO
VNLSERDRKIAVALVPIIVLVAYWFLLLAPKRQEASTASQELAKQTERRDAARTQAQASQGAKTDFAADYGEIVRLGKAIPSGVDMPSLMVQLDRAAEGTDIRFTRIATGERDPAAPAPTPAATTPAPSGQSGAQNTTPVQAGGETAQSAPGGAVEAANNTAQSESQNAAAASQSGVSPSDTQTSTSTGSGLPIGGGAATPGATPTGGSAPALDSVPLELEFVGNFFNLADFFHDVKRFVRVANQNVVVSGRLITVEGVKFSSDPELFPRIKAELKATIYLAPKSQGTTAGATPNGPAPATPGATTTPASTPSSTPSPAPTATATP